MSDADALRETKQREEILALRTEIEAYRRHLDALQMEVKRLRAALAAADDQIERQQEYMAEHIHCEKCEPNPRRCDDCGHLLSLKHYDDNGKHVQAWMCTWCFRNDNAPARGEEEKRV